MSSTSGDCTQLLDLSDALLMCLVEAASLKDPTSYKHGLICQKFEEISRAAHSAIEIASWPCHRPVITDLQEFANLSRLSIKSCQSSTALEDLLTVAPVWSHLHAFEASLPPPTTGGFFWCQQPAFEDSHSQLKKRSLCSEALTLFFQGCTTLRSLTLKGLAGDIPPSITSLALLETLVLGNKLSLPHNIGNLHRLRSLELETSAKSLPSSLTSISDLQHLKLDASNLSHLPDAIGKLGKLTYLHVSSGDLTHLPDSIGNLRRLRELWLDGCCSLTTLPETLKQVSSLQMLDIWRSGEVSNLPISSFVTSRLQELDASDLSDLEDLRHLPHLKSLSLSGFGYPLPETIGSLQQISVLEVDCYTNRELPAAIGELRCLKSLSMLFLESLLCLPEQLSSLQQLTKLHITDCDALEQVDPVTSLRSLKKLYICNCDSVGELPEDLLHCCSALKELALTYLPALRKLPNGLWDNTTLKSLTLCKCDAASE